jgi:hypothetical protein
MKRERGCGRNYGMNGGGTATYSMGTMVAPGSYLAPVVDGGACSVARPGLVHVEPRGLMGGGRRRQQSRRRNKMRGGRYGFDLTGQGMAPNQFAAVVPMRGESCTQSGGAPVLQVATGGYSVGGQLVTNQAGGIVPILAHGGYDSTANISPPCNKMGGGGRKSRKAKKSRKTKKHTRKSHSRKHKSRGRKTTRRH